jgi:transcriptional regulator of acetoin/glycerol metabolism
MLGEERSSAHDVSSMIRITAVLVGVSSLLGLLSRVRDQHPFDLGTGVGLTLVRKALGLDGPTTGGNVTRTAEKIALQRSNLYVKLDKYGLK